MEHRVLGKSITCGIIVLFIGMSITPVGSSLSFDKQTFPSGSIPASDSVKTSSPIDVNLTVSGTHGNGDWYISPVTLTFTGDGTVMYRFFNESWLPWTDGPIVVIQQGNITFQWYWVDWNGTVSPIHTVWLHIDYTPPVVNIIVKRLCHKLKITVTAYDNISGLGDRIEIWIGPYLQFTATVTNPFGNMSAVWILSPIPHHWRQFAHTVRATVDDIAGNEGTGNGTTCLSQCLPAILLLRNSALDYR